MSLRVLRDLPRTRSADALRALIMGVMFGMIGLGMDAVWPDGADGGVGGEVRAGALFGALMFGCLRWMHRRSAKSIATSDEF